MRDLPLMYVGTLLMFHILFFFGGQAGVVDAQVGDSQSDMFISNFAEGNVTKAAENGTDTGSRIKTDSSGTGLLASLTFISTISNIITAPYSAVTVSGLPIMFQITLKALMGLAEGFVIYRLIRG